MCENDIYSLCIDTDLTSMICHKIEQILYYLVK